MSHGMQRALKILNRIGLVLKPNSIDPGMVKARKEFLAQAFHKFNKEEYDKRRGFTSNQGN